MKVLNLTGAPLDLWVARAKGWTQDEHERWRDQRGRAMLINFWMPSTDWAQGGPIIETGNIQVTPFAKWENGDCWSADVWGGKNHTGYIPNNSYGPTALIAAMRAYVASVYGETVPQN